MTKGQVKWFNDKRGYGSRQKMERTYLSTTLVFREKALNPCKRGTELNVKSLKVPKVLNLQM